MRCCWVWTHDSHQNVSFFTHISYHKERGPNRLYIYEYSKDIIIIEKRKVIIILLLLLFLLGLISFSFRCWKQCVLLHIMIQSLSLTMCICKLKTCFWLQRWSDWFKRYILSDISYHSYIWLTFIDILFKHGSNDHFF